MRFPSELPIRPRHHPARLRPASANAVSRTSLSFFLFSTDLTDAPVHLHARNPHIMRTLAFHESSARRTLSLLRFTDTGSQRYPIVRRIRALWAKCGTRVSVIWNPSRSVVPGRRIRTQKPSSSSQHMRGQLDILFAALGCSSWQHLGGTDGPR